MLQVKRFFKNLYLVVINKEEGFYSFLTNLYLYNSQINSYPFCLYVHFILGNHEIMNLAGDIRYVHQKYKENVTLLNENYVAGLYGENSELGRWLVPKAIKHYCLFVKKSHNLDLFCDFMIIQRKIQQKLAAWKAAKYNYTSLISQSNLSGSAGGGGFTGRSAGR